MNEISDTQPDPHAVLFCRRHLCFLTLQSHRCTWCQNNTAHSNAPWHTTALTGSSAASSPSSALSLLLAEQHNEATAKNIKASVIGHVLLPKKLKLKTSWKPLPVPHLQPDCGLQDCKYSSCYVMLFHFIRKIQKNIIWINVYRNINVQLADTLASAASSSASQDICNPDSHRLPPPTASASSASASKLELNLKTTPKRLPSASMPPYPKTLTVSSSLGESRSAAAERGMKTGAWQKSGRHQMFAVHPLNHKHRM